MLLIFYTALWRVLYWPNFRYQGSDTFEKLMETFRHILLFLPCSTGISDEGWELQEQGLSRPILSTSSIQIEDGTFRTTGVIQSHHRAF